MESNNNINLLLNKYWEGETSLQEEAQLKQYFREGSVAPEHTKFAPLFGFFESQQSVSADVDLAEPLQEKAVVRRLSVRRYVMSIAAILTLVLSAVTVMNIDSSSTQYQGKYTEITDEQEAIEMTREALAFLTKKMDTSTREVSRNVKLAEKADIFK